MAASSSQPVISGSSQSVISTKRENSYKRLVHGVDNSILLEPTSNISLVAIGPGQIFSDGYYPVHNKQGSITVFFELESIGQELSAAVYPSIRCFTKPDDQSEISSVMAGGGGISNGLTITSIISNRSFKISGEDPEFDNYDQSVGIGVAIFCDGDTTKYFDHFIFSKLNQPFFELVDGILTFAESFHVPQNVIDRIIDGNALIRIHKGGHATPEGWKGGHAYVYPISHLTVPKELTRYSFKIDVTPSWSTGKHLRMGTNYIRIGFLTNYHQGKEAKLLIKNLHVTQLDYPPLTDSRPMKTIVTHPEYDYKRLNHGSNRSVIMEKTNHTDIIAVGNGEVYSDGYYPIHDKTGKITVFYTLESVGEVTSRVYPTIRCFSRPDDHPDSEITAAMAGTNGISCGLILSSVISNKSFKVTGDDPEFEKFSGVSDTTMTHMGVAIFCDGDTTKNFDHFIPCHRFNPFFKLEKDSTNSSNIFDDSWILTFDDHFVVPKDIIQDMIDGKALFRIHKHTGGHLYPINNFFVPKELTTYSFDIDVTPDWQSGSTGKHLRMGTRYIRVGLLTNYGQDKDAKLVIKNIHVGQLD